MEWPAYKGVFYGEESSNTVAITQKYTKYYIECMLRIWERYETLPLVENAEMRFEDCAPAILYFLSTGFTAKVYLEKDDPKPYRYISLGEKRAQAAMKARRAESCLYPQEDPREHFPARWNSESL